MQKAKVLVLKKKVRSDELLMFYVFNFRFIYMLEQKFLREFERFDFYFVVK